MTKTNKFGLPMLVLLLAVSAIAQTQPVDQKVVTTAAPPTKALDLGQLDGVNYANDFFGLSLSIPREWVVTTAPKNLKDTLKAESEAQKERVLDSIDRSTVLLALTKLPAGEPNNASFMLIAERIPRPAIKNGLDVIASMKKAMTGTNFKVEFQGEAVTEQISGRDFGVITVKNSSPFGDFQQKIYVTVKQGYALELFFTYTSPADLSTFDAIVKTINLK
jgi:hypothetical protein